MTTAAIEHVNEWEKDGKVRWYVDFVDGTKAVCFSELAKELVTGKPLPEGWIVEPPKQEGWNPMLKPPRKGGGGFGGGPAAFRNTRDGFYAEQDSIHRSVALDKAIAFHAMKVEPPTLDQLLTTADKLKTWLSGTKPLPGAGDPDPSSGKAQNRTHAQGGSASPAGAQGKLGEGEPVSPAGVCAHEHTSPLKPDGSALPHGFVRCLGCGVVHKGAA